MSEETQSHSHVARMQRKKAVVDANIAAAQDQRGLLIIHTGNGKGKSSAAFGVLARALGHGMRAAVIQFIKSRSDTGEEAFFRQSSQVNWHVMGDGFTWETQNAEQDAMKANAAWKQALHYLQDDTIDLLILDEFTYAINYGWVRMEDVVIAFAARPAMQHVIVTGRAAPQALVDIADTVSDSHLIKHAFTAGVKAMPGIEF